MGSGSGSDELQGGSGRGNEEVQGGSGRGSWEGQGSQQDDGKSQVVNCNLSFSHLSVSSSLFHTPNLLVNLPTVQLICASAGDVPAPCGRTHQAGVGKCGEVWGVVSTAAAAPSQSQ